MSLIGRDLAIVVTVALLGGAVSTQSAEAPAGAPGGSGAGAAEQLPGTEPLTWPAPLDVRLRAGAHRFIARKAEDCLQGRSRYWN
ncbi:MAG: hypothetical protein WCQ21_38595, partial [Verrucomicrobiota bacterium]